MRHAAGKLARVREAIESGHTSSGGAFSRQAGELLQEATGAGEVLLTTSCTAALELSAMLLDLGPDDVVLSVATDGAAMYGSERERTLARDFADGFDAVAAGPADLDFENRERYAPHHAALTGWTEAEARGQPLADVFRIVQETTRQPAPNPAAKVLNEGRVVGEVFALNLVLALLALISTRLDSTAGGLALWAIGAAAVVLLLTRFSRRMA